MRAADTNVILRLLVRDDPAQFARATIEAGRGLWISHVVLLEVVWVLESAYGRDRAAISEAVRKLLHAAEFALQDPDVVRATAARFEVSPGVDFADCLILEIASKAGQLPLATFDVALGKLDGAERLV